MKFYTRVLGGRDYSLLETIHFGLRLPATLSSFGDVRPISISDWSVVKPGSVLKHTHRDERATFKNKREIFDNRQHLSRPNTVEEDDLKNLSMYAFWRLLDVGSSLRYPAPVGHTMQNSRKNAQSTKNTASELF